MKPKKLTKKISLNKKTVANLNQGDLGYVRGGNKTGVTCGRLCLTIDYSCVETQCATCAHTCPATWCDTECGC